MPSMQKQLGSWTQNFGVETLACAGIAAGFFVAGLSFLVEFANAAASLH